MDPNDIQDVSPDVIASAERFTNGPHADLTPYDTDMNDPEGKKLSFTKDPSRYLGHAAKGLARSPIDLVKGLLGLPAQIVKGLGVDLPTLIANPSLVTEIPQAAKDAAEFANTHPDDMGSLLGQALLAPKVPGAANAALRNGPRIAGKTLSAVGRGAEAAGEFAAKTNKKGIVPLVTAATGHPWMTAAELAAPPVLKGAGKLAQKGGAALEGLDLSYKGRVPFERAATEVGPDPAEVMREKVAGARGDVEAGFARPVAAKLNGLKSKATDVSHPTAEVVSPGELFPYQSESIKGLAEARKAAAGDNAWANDASAQPAVPVVERASTPADYAMDNAFTRARGGEPAPRMNDLAHELPKSEAFKGLQDAVRRSKLSPIEKFLEDDPQAAVGGEGRMTGQFDEGSGGLTDAAAGRLPRYPSPAEQAVADSLHGGEFGPDQIDTTGYDSAVLDAQHPDYGGIPAEFGPNARGGPLSPLDALSRLSGRGVSGMRANELLTRFGGRGR